MFGEISDTNDFEDWIKCVKQKEKARHIQFMKIPLILYVFQLESNTNFKMKQP
jgi:hypothetical protein